MPPSPPMPRTSKRARTGKDANPPTSVLVLGAMLSTLVVPALTGVVGAVLVGGLSTRALISPDSVMSVLLLTGAADVPAPELITSSMPASISEEVERKLNTEELERKERKRKWKENIQIRIDSNGMHPITNDEKAPLIKEYQDIEP